MSNHICKACNSQNTEPEIIIHGRQRFRCLDCKVIFFDDLPIEPGVDPKIEVKTPEEKPRFVTLTCIDCGKEREYPRSSPTLLRADKIYRCKYCHRKHRSAGAMERNKASKSSTTGDKRRETYKEEGWQSSIKTSLRALSKHNVSDYYDKVMDILVKCLKLEPRETTETLIGLGVPFTIPQLQREAFSLFILQLFESMEEFEKVKNGTYKLRDKENR